VYYHQNNNNHDNVYCDNNISVVFSFGRMRRQARFSWRNRKKNIIILIYGRRGPRTIRLHFISIYIMVKKTTGPTNCFSGFSFYILLFFLTLLLCVIIIIRVALSLGHLSLLCCCSAEFLFHPLSVMGSDFLFYL